MAGLPREVRPCDLIKTNSPDEDLELGKLGMQYLFTYLPYYGRCPERPLNAPDFFEVVELHLVGLQANPAHDLPGHSQGRYRESGGTSANAGVPLVLQSVQMAPAIF